jgi:hypothetical protein
MKTLKIILLSIVLTLLAVFILAVILGSQKQMNDKQANFPFQVKYRKALTGSGYVDLIINTTGKSEAVKVTLSNPTLARTKTYSTVIDGLQTREIGYLQGWAASSGDVIALEWSGVTKTFNIP